VTRDAIAEALEPLLDALADRIVAKLTAGERSDMVDQVASPLGRRRHCAAVRRRVEAGDEGAAIVGRRHLLSKKALGEELATTSTKRKRTATPELAPVDDLAPLRAKYGLEKTRKGAA
jgi:hypothetical protein